MTMNLFISLQSNFELLEKKSELLRTMGHPIRLSIIELLSRNEKLTVTELYSELEIDQPVASHHLRIMKKSNILKSIKEGKNAFYSLADPNIQSIFELLLNIH